MVKQIQRFFRTVKPWLQRMVSQVDMGGWDIFSADLREVKMDHLDSAKGLFFPFTKMAQKNIWPIGQSTGELEISKSWGMVMLGHPFGIPSGMTPGMTILLLAWHLYWYKSRPGQDISRWSIKYQVSQQYVDLLDISACFSWTCANLLTQSSDRLPWPRCGQNALGEHACCQVGCAAG